MGLLNRMQGAPPVRPMMPQGANVAPRGMGSLSNGEADFLGQGFAQNPQFMQQLQAILQGQGPGAQPPQFTPPTSPMAPMPAQGQIPPVDPPEGPRGFPGLRPGFFGR